MVLSKLFGWLCGKKIVEQGENILNKKKIGRLEYSKIDFKNQIPMREVKRLYFNKHNNLSFKEKISDKLCFRDYVVIINRKSYFFGEIILKNLNLRIDEVIKRMSLSKVPKTNQEIIKHPFKDDYISVFIVEKEIVGINLEWEKK